jgi:hypothetical protein
MNIQLFYEAPLTETKIAEEEENERELIEPEYDFSHIYTGYQLNEPDPSPPDYRYVEYEI